MTDVKFYEAFDEEEKTLRASLPESVTAEFTSATIQESGDQRPSARLICIRTQSIIPTAWSENIEGVLSRSQGFDHLWRFQQEVPTMLPLGYLGKYCSQSVAEHAVMVSLNLIKKLKKQEKQFLSFHRDQLTGLNAKGRKALVVGVGSIGHKIAAMAQAMGMNIKGVDIAPKLKDIEYVSLQEGIKWAEIIYCAVPLTDLTSGLLNYEKIKAGGSGKFLINVSRGEITPIQGMQRLLQENILAGLGLDVFENETVLADELRLKNNAKSDATARMVEMSKSEKVVFTPHNAFNTTESVDKKACQSIEAAVRFFKERKFEWQL